MKKLLIATIIVLAYAAGARAQEPVIPYTGDGGTSRPVVWAPVFKAGITNGAVNVITTGPRELGLAICDNVNSTAWTYLQVFDALAANVTVGTTVPKAVFPLAPVLATIFTMDAAGLSFRTAISVAATTTPAGSSAPATNTINCTFGVN
jgi:hypothetical protein